MVNSFEPNYVSNFQGSHLLTLDLTGYASESRVLSGKKGHDLRAETRPRGTRIAPADFEGQRTNWLNCLSKACH